MHYFEHQKDTYEIYFLLGKGPDLSTLNEEDRIHHQNVVSGIIKEAKQYNDIVVGDFLDTYENLPIKTNLGYQFFSDFCEERDLKIS